MTKIFLDPGHGGIDSGETANGYEEKVINLSVALKLRSLLVAQGIEVVMSRETDVAVALNDRPRLANASGANLFLSIHHNGGGGVGYEIYKNADIPANAARVAASASFASLLAAEFNALGRKPHNGGVLTRKGSDGYDYYAVLCFTSMAGNLAEFAYLDSVDITAIDSDAEQQTEAQAYANAVFKFFGIIPQAPVQVVPPVITVIPESPLKQLLREAQAELNAMGIRDYAGQALDVDGVMGEHTRSALKKLLLKQDSTGACVKYLQALLGGLEIDGQFGPLTDAAVRNYQRQFWWAPWDVDGKVGPNTWGKLIG